MLNWRTKRTTALAVFPGFRLLGVLGVATLTQGCQSGVPGNINTPPSIDVDSANAMKDGCQPIKRSDGFMSIRVSIDGSGKRCLVQNLVQRNVYDGIDRRNRGSPSRDGVVSVFQARDLVVDLGGHLVTGAPFDDTTGIYVQSDSTRISIRDGLIRTPGPSGLGVAMAPYKTPGKSRPSPEDDRPMTRARVNEATNQYELTNPWDYQPPTHYTIDNLKIESGGRGVILVGSDNILRNSTIEVDSPTAVYIYGPHAIVEGNTFIVHRTVGQAEGMSAALKLRDADGAVIRNNRFIVKGFLAGNADVAINLLESRDVLIENNVAEGARRWVRKDAASNTIERGNELK